MDKLTETDAGLCGVHTLNNLLQGPIFTEIDLMSIAQELDAAEQSVMAEMGTETQEFLKFAAVSNVAFVFDIPLARLCKRSGRR